MSDGLRSIRPLAKESLRGIEPSKIGRRTPKFEWIDPRTLYVEEAYQRDLSGNSTALVRKIVSRFNWSRFKPPICVRLPDSGNVLVCIDGQHTAMAAATHPDVDKIPVMVVDATDVASRAAAFVGHNRDRLSLTQMAIYHAELAAGDELAKVIDRACRAAGATILNKAVNLRSALPAGTTIAVGTIRTLARKQGEEALARVLRLLTKAGRGPIKADEIAAVALILEAAGGERAIDDRLRAVVEEKTAEKWASVCSRYTAESGDSLSSALASEWCRKLGLRLRGPSTKGGSKSTGTRLLEGGAPMRPIEEKVVPSPASPEPPRTRSQVNPIQQKTVPRQPPAPVRQPIQPERKAADPPEAPFEKNGVRVDFAASTVRRGRFEAPVSIDAARLVAILVRVSPAFLEADAVAAKVWGRAGPDANLRLRALADEANGATSKLGMEIKQVMKTGWMISVPASEEVS